MEAYPSEAALLDIFNFCTACTVTIIDPDLEKGGRLYTVLQSNSPVNKVTVEHNPLVILYSCCEPGTFKEGKAVLKFTSEKSKGY